MAEVLYQLPLSLYSFKVRLALAIKGLDLECREPPGGSYRSAAYRALVPSGTIPALVADGTVLTESDAIIEYLDEVHGGRRLVGGPPVRKARIRMLSRICDLQLEAQVRALFAHVALRTRDPGHVAAVSKRLEDAFTLLEAMLDAAGPFAVDHEPTMADCGLAATLTWFDALAPVLLENELRPGPRAARTFDALCDEPHTGSALAAYAPLVAAWVAQKLADGAA